MLTLRIVHMTSVHSAVDPRIFHKECRSLAKAGFAVTVIGPHPADAVKDDVQIKSVPKNTGRLARMTSTAWRVYREARKQNADVYHFHDPELIPAGLLLRAQGKKVIYDIHEDLPKDILSKHYLPSWSRVAISWMINGLELAASARFSALVTVTPSIAERFLFINKKTIIVHNYPYVEELMQAVQSSPWNDRRQSVAYIGGITVQRAIREMVSAMSLLPEALPATLELAGPEIPSEADSAQLRKHAGWQRVLHHGFLDQPSTFRILQSVKAGLVLFYPEPNHLEAMPQKIFEYMGAGLPIIASDFPLWRRIIGDAGCGLFVDPLKPAEIARAIEFVLTHAKEAEEMGRRGRLAVAQKFNWGTEARKLVDLYKTMGVASCAA